MVKSTVYLNRAVSAVQAGCDIKVRLDGARVLVICDANLEEISINDIAEYVFQWEAFLRTRRNGSPVPAVKGFELYSQRGA